jgi:uncharacterized Zn finger protein
MTAWRTGESCPGCGSELTLLDDGGPRLTMECHSCGRTDTWTSGQAGGGQ